jgi:hypothetical protein
VARYLRVADPIEQWDGSQSVEETIAALCEERQWSHFLLDGVTATDVLVAFYGNRKSPSPRRDPGYVVFTEKELTDSGGVLRQAPASFNWPGNVAAAHFDLIDFHRNPQSLFTARPPRDRLERFPRADLLFSIAKLAAHPGAGSAFVEQAIARINKLKRSDASLYARILDDLARSSTPPPWLHRVR